MAFAIYSMQQYYLYICQHYMRTFFLAIFLLLSLSGSVLAQRYTFDFNQNCHEAYEKIMSLKVVDGLKLLKATSEAQPNNLIPVFIENYDDFIVLMFNGDPNEYAQRKKNLDIRIQKINRGSSKDPWYKFSKANIYFQWAMIKVRFGDYLAAANDFRKSYQLIKENKEQFPNFKYNNILYGFEEALVGTIPDKYKWISSVLGMKGDVKKGTARIADFLNTRDSSTKYLRIEAIFYYCYLKYNLISDHDAVWSYLQKSALDYKGNHLFAFLKANIALNMNKAQEAEQVLKQRVQSKSYVYAPVLDYFLGLAYYNNNNAACIPSFQKFLDHYKGDLYVKDAYQRLSIYSFVNGDHIQYQHYKEAILKHGSTLIEADKQAERFANAVQQQLHKDLLLARMYTDGGYLHKSLQILRDIPENSLEDVTHILEYNYRYARVYAIQKNWDAAIPYFKKTIDVGANRQEHFAARSCIELGELYERKGQKAKALQYYQQCLSMKNHDYKSALDQKAKAGINRLSN